MREITVEQLATALEADHESGNGRQDHEVFVLDVREPEEYVQGHVPGAVLIPMSQLASRMAEVPLDRPVHVICRSGNRSASMTEVLERAGVDASNVAGGTAGWARAGRGLVTGTDPR